jgi:hypothetical protein
MHSYSPPNLPKEGKNKATGYNLSEIFSMSKLEAGLLIC